MKANSKRNLQLDILRGIAILLVIGRHLELERPDGPLGAFATIWFRLGWLGVDLFFVLSGFLIGGLLLSELHKHGTVDVPRFLVRRGLKIYPPYFVFMAYLMMMPTAKALLHGESAWSAFLQEWGQYWPNLLFLQNYVGTNPAGHTWSLAVEEHFYLILPFVLLALIATRRVHLLIPLCVTVVLACLGLRFISVWTNDPFATRMAATHLRLDALLFGVGIRGVAQYFPEIFQAFRHWRLLFLVAGILLWLPNSFIDPGTTVIRTIGFTAILLGSASFLLAAYHTHASDFGRWARHVSPVASLIGWIGVHSYAIYLWHVTAIGILDREFAGRMIQWTGGVSQPVWLLSVSVITAGVIAAGVIASKVVEWPVLRFRDGFFPSRSGSLPTAAAIHGGGNQLAATMVFPAERKSAEAPVSAD